MNNIPWKSAVRRAQAARVAAWLSNSTAKHRCAICAVEVKRNQVRCKPCGRVERLTNARLATRTPVEAL